MKGTVLKACELLLVQAISSHLELADVEDGEILDMGLEEVERPHKMASILTRTVPAPMYHNHVSALCLPLEQNVGQVRRKPGQVAGDRVPVRGQEGCAHPADHRAYAGQFVCIACRLAASA